MAGSIRLTVVVGLVHTPATSLEIVIIIFKPLTTFAKSLQTQKIIYSTFIGKTLLKNQTRGNLEIYPFCMQMSQTFSVKRLVREHCCLRETHISFVS